MVNVIKEKKGNALLVRLSGSIEESVNFEQLIGPPVPEMHVSCKEISRISSVGVKAWIKYFQAAQTKGSRLQFQDCSPAIVEQINLISNFTCGGTVETVYVPFACTGCKSELMGLFRTEDLKRQRFQIPEVKCGKCGGKAVFDDIAEEYFAFLTR